MSAVALVVADGRLGGMPLCLATVGGVPLVVHAVDALKSAGVVNQLVVTTQRSEVDDVVTVLGEYEVLPDSDVLVIEGGAYRADSIRRAFAVAIEQRSGDPAVVLVHHVARALAPPALVRSVVAEVLGGAEAVVPVLPCDDTVKRIDATETVIDSPERSQLRVAQTPIGYQIGRLPLAEDGHPLVGARTVPGHPNAREISTLFDLAVAEASLICPTRQEVR